MEAEKREKLLDILISFAHDELRYLTFVILGDGVYEGLSGTTRRSKAISLLKRLESMDQVGDLIEQIKKRRPDINLSEFASEARSDLPKQAGLVNQRDNIAPTLKPPPQAKSIPPEFAEKMRQRRPGYDMVYKLIRQYDEIPPDKRAGMSAVEVTDLFVWSMFDALGWSVMGDESAARVVRGTSRPVNLILEYHDLRVPVEVRKFGDALDSYTEKRTGPWEILTNFETILIWDMRNPDVPHIFLETSPRFYVVDDREEDDLLAAEILYERLVQPTSKVPPTEMPSSSMPPLEAPPSTQPVSEPGEAPGIGRAEATPSVQLVPEPIEIAIRALSDRPSEVDLLGFSD